MKRMRRRAVGIVLGLALGWIAQGYVSQYFTAAQAASPESASMPHDADADSGSASLHDLAGAEHLRPSPAHRCWHAGLVGGIAGLFVLALVIGIPARRFADTSTGDEDGHDSGDGHAQPMHRHASHH